MHAYASNPKEHISLSVSHLLTYPLLFLPLHPTLPLLPTSSSLPSHLFLCSFIPSFSPLMYSAPCRPSLPDYLSHLSPSFLHTSGWPETHRWPPQSLLRARAAESWGSDL